VGNMQIYLRAKDKVFINGAVIKADRKVSLELLNDATFLLENHVLQKEDATTPFKQLYFIVQMMLMDPSSVEQTKVIFKDMVAGLLESLTNRSLIEGVKDIDVSVSSGKAFPALKLIRELYPIEEAILNTEASGVLSDVAAQAAMVAKGLAKEKT